MTQPERPPAEEILRWMPELAPYAREAVLLHPQQAAVRSQQSSIGGPLLWPAEEPWPTCSLPDTIESTGSPPVSMVPVAQLFARDMPGPWWPEGVDLLQILWCPNEHWDPPEAQADASPVVEVHWWNTSEAGDHVTTPPKPARTYDFGFLPTPCRLRTEHITDFPYRDVLPEGLRSHLAQLIERTGDGTDVITRVRGWKLGGWPSWHLTDVIEQRCPRCQAGMSLLFTVASDDETEIVVGRWGELRIFLCEQDWRHPIKVDLQ